MISDPLRYGLIAFSLLLAACSGYQAVVPTGGAGAKPVPSKRSDHVVVAGETLYSIAWDSGRDYRDVARWNGIKAPYLIKPGQRLRLRSPAAAAKLQTASSGSTYYRVRRGETLFGIAQKVEIPYRSLAAWNQIAPPYVIKPGQRLRLTPVATAANPADSKARSRKTAQKHKSRAAKVPNVAVKNWQWPLTGPVIKRFSSKSRNKGIDIAGKSGQAVRAAASGTVVYQGSGLRGYGKLIIIKHNADYLSAYAHCDRIYVREGDVIKRGQRIATVGSTGTNRIKLHFEIRRRGNPVNPLQFLSKK